MPANPIRLLHLSDFQVGREPRAERELFKPIIDEVIRRCDSGAAPDLVLITGDIAYSALPEQYDEFAYDFLVPLSVALGDKQMKRIFVVPGDHDADCGKVAAVKTHSLLQDFPAILDPGAAGLTYRSTLFPRFQAFAEAELPSNNRWLFSEAGCDVQVLDLRNQQIGLVRLNTAWLATNTKEDRHQLSPGLNIAKQALERAELRGCAALIVMGHHPIDWLIDGDVSQFYELFGRYNLIYLHGHTLNTVLGQEEGAGYNFVSLRAAAAFQARESEQWVSGCSWYELDANARELAAEPLRWQPGARGWQPEQPGQLNGPALLSEAAFKPASERWHYSLNNQLAKETTLRSDGWQLINSAFLAQHQTDSDDEQIVEEVLHYFDGGQPSWRIILAQAPSADGSGFVPYVPQRTLAKELKRELESARQNGGVDITFLTDAIGEGKSTVLRQVVCDLARDSERWTVIWHSDNEQPLRKEFLMSLPGSRAYLIVSDDAEAIVRDVFERAQWLRSNGRRNFHFLLCCRDTDWLAAKGPDLLQRNPEVPVFPTTRKRLVPAFPSTLKGLTIADAHDIVIAWQRLGPDGLRDLYSDQFDIKEAAQRFVDAARSEEYTKIGAFFGALLRMRFGENLKQHVEQLLWKLHSRSAPPRPNGNLMDAFAYIAAMHAENLLFLSKPVLAEVLHCTDGSELQNQVIKPLGAEAFVSAGERMLTRHRLIAEAAVEILSGELLSELDKGSFDDLYGDIMIAAEELIRANKLNDRDQIKAFDAMPDTLCKNGNLKAGIQAGRALLKRWPNELRFLVELSKLYRHNDMPEQATRLFREPEREPYPYDRACYNEWATAEGIVGRFFLDVWLSGVALADEIERNLKLKMAVTALNGLTIAFHRVFVDSSYQDHFMIEACGAAAQLARQLDYKGEISSHSAWNQVAECLRTCGRYGVTPIDQVAAMRHVEDGIQLAWSQREGDLPEWSWLPTDTPLVFTKLRSMVGAR